MPAALFAAGCSVADNADARRAHQPQAHAEMLECRVSRISDGDSFVCGKAGRVRLLMIDAPELAQGTEGRRARKELEDLAPQGTLVRIESDIRPTDDYGRILGYAWLPNGRMLNEEMARAGMVTALVYPPNVKHAERIRKAVREAQAGKRGLWATSFFDCTPRDFRAGRCDTSRPRNQPEKPSVQRQ